MTSIGTARPCLNEFLEERALPSAVLGPVECHALSLLILALREPSAFDNDCVHFFGEAPAPIPAVVDIVDEAITVPHRARDHAVEIVDDSHIRGEGFRCDLVHRDIELGEELRHVRHRSRIPRPVEARELARILTRKAIEGFDFLLPVLIELDHLLDYHAQRRLHFLPNKDIAKAPEAALLPRERREFARKNLLDQGRGIYLAKGCSTQRREVGGVLAGKERRVVEEVEDGCVLTGQ